MLQHLFGRIPSAVAASALAFCLAAPAAAQPVEWRGAGYVFNFSDQCQALGWQGSSITRVRYRPRDLGSNGPGTRISFLYDWVALNFERPNGPIPARFVNVRGSSLGAVSFNYADRTRMRIDTHVPRRPQLDSDTPTVRIGGRIANWDNIRGCRADFEATLLRQR